MQDRLLGAVGALNVRSAPNQQLQNLESAEVGGMVDGVDLRSEPS